MATVKHMKWWGWGVEGVGFHHEDKPGFAPFVLNAVDLDLYATEPFKAMGLDELTVPEPRIEPQLLAELTDVVGPDNIESGNLDRIVHTYGKSLRDLVRL